MPAFNSELLVVLSEQVSSYKQIESVVAKYDLMPFNVLSPANVVNIDKEINANPYVLAEAVSFVEVVKFVSDFYSESDINFLELCKNNASDNRVSYAMQSQNSSLDLRLTKNVIHSQLMGEYFVDKPTEVYEFLGANPAYLGFYIYLLVVALVK